MPRMSKPNAHQLDLNLLVVLESLLIERSVTGAARKLGVTQSAVSHRLKALREQLGDPLFVSDREGLVPTDVAIAMTEPLQAALASVRSAVRLAKPFSPQSSSRRFALASSDYGELLLLCTLLAHVGQAAPSITFDMANRDEHYAAKLTSGALDLAFLGGPPDGDSLMQLKVLEEPFVVLARNDHPQIRKRLTMKAYLRCQHILVAPSGRPGGIVDSLLAKQGLKRNVVVRLANFMPAPFLAAQSDLLVTVPAALALRVIDQLPLSWYRPPLAIEKTVVRMVWHPRAQADPGHAWLRSLVSSHVKSLQSDICSRFGA